MTHSPKSSEISVVIQGPIVGIDPTLEKGPLTQRCLESIRRHLPDSELVLSTWQGSDVSDLTYDRLILSKDPGNSPSFAPKGQNINRLIVSTYAGLGECVRPFVLKLRTDIELTGTNFLDYFTRYSVRDPACLFADRVVTWTWLTKTPARSASGLFHLSDMVHFGRREDVTALWTIPPLIKSEDELAADQARFADTTKLGVPSSYYTPEQYLCVNWLKTKRTCELLKRATPEAQLEWEELLAANFVVLDPEKFAATWKDGVRLTKTAWAETYSHAEWQMLYRKHCDPASPKVFDRDLPLKRLIQLAQKRMGWLARAYSELYHSLAPQGAKNAPIPWTKILAARWRKPPR